MKRNVQKILRPILFLGILVLIPTIGLGIMNMDPPRIISEADTTALKSTLADDARQYQNPAGIFLNPTIESVYHAANIFRWYHNAKFNETFDFNETAAACIEWLWKRQNTDGGFSDVGYMSNVRDTYFAIMAIDTFDNLALVNSLYDNQIQLTLQFFNACVSTTGGYMVKPNATSGDMQSTYFANMTTLKLAAFGHSHFCNVSIPKLLLQCFRTTGYYASADSEEEDITSTYYGMKLNSSFSVTYWRTIFSQYYHTLDGTYGFGETISAAASDIASTAIGVNAWADLGYSMSGFAKASTNKFANNCQNLATGDDGGFRSYPNYITHVGSLSWSDSALYVKNQTCTSPGDALFSNANATAFRGFFGNTKSLHLIFGEMSVSANFWGLKAIWDTYGENGAIKVINPTNITKFLKSCKNMDGGYGDMAVENSSTYSAFCAVKVWEYLNDLFPASDFVTDEDPQTSGMTYIPVSAYLLWLQNPDGGFKAGVNGSLYASFIGGSVASMYEGNINENISLVPATYWGVAAMNSLGNYSYAVTAATNYLLAAQNVDGGFSAFLGFHSDIASSYYAMLGLQELDQEAIDTVALVNFAQGAQANDGSFVIMPAMNSGMGGSTGMSLDSTFLVTAFGAEILYGYGHEPNLRPELANWVMGCFDTTSGGIGDYPGFGGSLHNTVYTLAILEELSVDQSFNREPWIGLFGTILILTLAVVGIYVVARLLGNIGATRNGRLREERLTSGDMFYDKYPAINVRNLSVIAGGKVIIDNVSMSLEHGEILGVLGESGAGKSTFVKALLGNRETYGQNFVYGFDAKKNAAKLRPYYGYVPQDLSKIYESFTVMDNLVTFGQQYGLSEDECIRRGRKLLKNLEIESKENELVKNLSGGQKRRVSIAIALIHQPIFCILDEPTSGLDPIVRENLWLRLVDINERYNTTLVVITHYPEESKFCHEVAIFARKRGMVDYGPPERLIATVPGRGRAIEITLKQFDDKVYKKLKDIKEFEMVLEKRAGLKYLLFSDLDLNRVYDFLKLHLNLDNIETITQTDTKMEDYFRYRMLDVKN